MRENREYVTKYYLRYIDCFIVLLGYSKNMRSFLASALNGNDSDFISGLILLENLGIHSAQGKNNSSTRFMIYWKQAGS